MKYLSLETVVKAYVENTQNTSNKFWGLLAIISSLNHEVRPCVSYTFEVQHVSNLLEKLFALKKDKKTYSQTTKWGVIFSNKWVEYVNKELLSNTPNIYDVIGWYFRNTPFEDDVNNDALIKIFLESSHLSVEVAKQVFDFKHKDLLFSDTLYSESQLASTLKAKFNIPATANTTITFDKNFVVASPGELARAPFVQPLYAGQGVQECLILTQFSFEDMYTTMKQTPNTDNQPLQQIYYGAPGTGKSHEIKKTTDTMPIENVFRTTFHPDSDYSTFVGCYKPTQVKKAVRNVAGDVVKAEGQEVYENTIQYEFVPQAFLKAYKRAYETDEPVVLVIEEINRGNCAQIFGDLFQLLDRKDGVSEYPIDADEDLRKYLIDTLGEDSPAIANGKLCLPSNLYIWATMNTSDQSLFPIDSAFKRRWEWKYTRIAQGKKEDGTLEHWKLENDTDWWDFLKKINAIIDDMTQSADKQLGYYFCKPDKENDTISYARFVNKVLFYLWNDIFKTFSTDEYEQLFKIKRLKTDADGKWIEPHELEDKESKLTFPELYDEKGDVIPEIAKQFIEKVIAWGGKPTTENA